MPSGAKVESRSATAKIIDAMPKACTRPLRPLRPEIACTVLCYCTHTAVHFLDRLCCAGRLRRLPHHLPSGAAVVEGRSLCPCFRVLL